MRRWTHKGLMRADGLPTVYAYDLNLLAELWEHAEAGNPWVDIRVMRTRERRLFSDGLIFISLNIATGRHEYKITETGRAVLMEHANRRRPRFDNICPRCEKVERANGLKYCHKCNSDRQRFDRYNKKVRSMQAKIAKALNREPR